jgi:hypothetical protein
MEITMNKETKETTPKERIVVLEKGKAIDIGPLAVCCWAAFMPFRAW